MIEILKILVGVLIFAALHKNEVKEILDKGDK